MKAQIGMRVKVTRETTKQIDSSICESTGTESLEGTIMEAKVIPNGYTDGVEYVHALVQLDNGGYQVIGDIDGRHGSPVISVSLI